MRLGYNTNGFAFHRLELGGVHAQVQVAVERAGHPVHEADALGPPQGGMEEGRADQEGHAPHGPGAFGRVGDGHGRKIGK